ncbi:hypothetical protein PR048_017506 [Dryococelus australis]|uniref:PiggyBac transposable element-derived protein domain-containing protein n=1 Tax=Dryococelus australis TaxID=614101 RepID=A0ABQ9HAB1_9NEOP|nr:hypothetical protein PR048_017506 [Dryococelus australis]
MILKPYPQKGHALYVDSWYMSYECVVLMLTTCSTTGVAAAKEQKRLHNPIDDPKSTICS